MLAYTRAHEATRIGGGRAKQTDRSSRRCGAMQLAGPGVFGPPKDRGAAIAGRREAVSQGVNHIDTMTFPMQRSGHGDLTLHEIADRLAIRERVDAYAHCADRRDLEGQMSLFTTDTEFLVTWSSAQ